MVTMAPTKTTPSSTRRISVPVGMKQNRPPTEGMQYFGTVRIDGGSEMMTVKLHNLKGDVIFSVDLPPDGVGGS